MSKKIFVESEIEVIEVDSEDIITTSPTIAPPIPFNLNRSGDPFDER